MQQLRSLTLTNDPINHIHVLPQNNLLMQANKKNSEKNTCLNNGGTHTYIRKNNYLRLEAHCQN